MELNAWLSAGGRGALARLARKTDLSALTIANIRDRKSEPLPGTRRRIAKGTGDEVSADELCLPAIHTPHPAVAAGDAQGPVPTRVGSSADSRLKDCEHNKRVAPTTGEGESIDG